MRRPPTLAASVLDAIGNTPLVELSRWVRRRGLRGRVLAKLESCNPGGSKKDRIALEIVREARASGALREGQTVVELTSGNTGTGLAIVCRALGHPFVAVISAGNSVERVLQMRALGAEVVVVDQPDGPDPGRVSGGDLEAVEAVARRIVTDRGAYRADQFANPANVLAHERHTGPEIWEQSGESVDVFVDMPGTGGSFTGVTRALREFNPWLRSYVVEPAGAAVLAGRPVTDPRHAIQGAGYSRTGAAIPLFDPALASGYLGINDDEAFDSARAARGRGRNFRGRLRRARTWRPSKSS
ncbi:MAG: cysteine synthase family protein [Isosphaeraceae bacterium]